MKKKSEEAQENQEAIVENTAQTVSNIDNQDWCVGAVLKKAREKKKKEIAQIANTLRIRPRYLEALEESRYQDFPGQAYAVGFLRNYALYLGLDGDALVSKYHKETAFLKPSVVEMPLSERAALFPSVKCLLLAVLAIVLVWFFWYFLTYRETQTQTTPPVLVAQEALTLDEVEPPSAEYVDAEEENKASENTNAIVEEKPAVKAVEQSKTASSVQIVAREEVWLEIEQDDTLILSRTLKKGEVYDVPKSDTELFLKTGNAGGMDILVDGQKVKPFGPVGAVRSGISLSADKLKKH